VTLRQALQRASEALASHDIEDATLEAELLLRHALRMSRTGLYAELGQEFPPDKTETFWQLIGRRLAHEPTAYILGRREFFGLDLYVDHRVLIPRPESELLVEKAIELAPLGSPRRLLADIGTGSGAIAISLALNLPQSRIYATDASAAALEVAAVNCERHKVADQVWLLQGDMLAPLPQPIDLIVANLPYIEEGALSQLSAEIRWFEPMSALAGGADGLESIGRLLAQAGGKLRPQGCLVLEVGRGQAEAVTSLAESHFPHARVGLAPDLSGMGRTVIVEV
jgi:release factor glutamine methyltransferase